jgi:hypothetical protein
MRKPDEPRGKGQLGIAGRCEGNDFNYESLAPFRWLPHNAVTTITPYYRYMLVI